MGTLPSFCFPLLLFVFEMGREILGKKITGLRESFLWLASGSFFLSFGHAFRQLSPHFTWCY